MQTSEFWMLIERARADTSEGDDWPSGSAIGAVLVERLAELPAERVIEFQLCYDRARARAYQWSVYAAAFVICGYISDDSFNLRRRRKNGITWRLPPGRCTRTLRGQPR